MVFFSNDECKKKKIGIQNLITSQLDLLLLRTGPTGRPHLRADFPKELTKLMTDAWKQVGRKYNIKRYRYCTRKDDLEGNVIRNKFKETVQQDFLPLVIHRRVNLTRVSYHKELIKNPPKHDSPGYHTPASQSPWGIIPQRAGLGTAFFYVLNASFF